MPPDRQANGAFHQSSSSAPWPEAKTSAVSAVVLRGITTFDTTGRSPPRVGRPRLTSVLSPMTRSGGGGGGGGGGGRGGGGEGEGGEGGAVGRGRGCPCRRSVCR